MTLACSHSLMITFSRKLTSNSLAHLLWQSMREMEFKGFKFRLAWFVTFNPFRHQPCKLKLQPSEYVFTGEIRKKVTAQTGCSGGLWLVWLGLHVLKICVCDLSALWVPPPPTSSVVKKQKDLRCALIWKNWISMFRVASESIQRGTAWLFN